MYRSLYCLATCILLTSTASANECDTTFNSVLERHTAAVTNRDLTTYMSTIAPRDEQMMILPDGSSWNSTDEIREGHKEWFKDTTWNFNKTLVRKDARDHWGLAVYRVSVDRPDQPGAPFLLSMLFAPEENGCWYLQHDQNTLLPGAPTP